MPKVDATRDYYADLQVSRSSSAEDVKKQYRKLAMQWHPDRNRGKEDEASKQFQIIQAAFEILTDPTLKRQYDEARNKTSARFPTSSGVRGNPWANAGAGFAPPPKRSGANAGTGTGTQPRPTPGAARYSDWGTGSARTSKPQPKDDASSAKAHYDAWTNMRPEGRHSGTPRKPPPTPGRHPTSAARDSKAPDPEGIPRTNSQKQKAQASFGNSARRTGYTPRSPGLGDELPVTNNNYSTTRTRPNIFPDDSASTARQNRRPSAAPDPLAQFRDNFMEGGRHSTPYATPGGEKTSLSSDGLNRAKSTRESNNSAKDEADGYFPRQRSSSTPRSSSNDGGSEDSTTADTGVKAESRKPPTNNGTPSRFSDRYRPQSAESTRPQSDGTEPIKPDATNPASGTDQSPKGPSKYGTSSFSPPAKQSCPITSSQSAKSQSAPTIHGASNVYSGDASTLSEVYADNATLSLFEQVLKNNMDHLIRTKELSSSSNNSMGIPGHAQYTKTVAKLHNKIMNSTDSFHSFGFASNPTTPGKRFASSSADNISTKFVEEENTDAWKFTAGGPSADDPSGASSMRSQSGSRLGRRSPPKVIRRPVPPRPSATPASATDGGSEETPAAGFSAAQWGEKIGSEHFVPRPNTNASASPAKRSNSRKNSKPVKMTRGGTAGMVDEDDEIPVPAAGWQDFVPGTQSPMAMDIDTPPVKEDSETIRVSQANGPRKIPVEPTRPEWRAGKVEGENQAPPELPQRPTLTTDTTTGTATQSKSAPTNVNPYAAHAGGSEDSEEFRANFADFKKVEPFTDPQPTGLQSFADLRTSLPFESQASGQVPLERVHPVPHLAFPPVPVAPRLPPTMAVPGLRPSNAQWRKYAQDFYNYMDKWEAFNEKVLTHFATRQTELGKRRQQHGRAWLEGAHGVDGASLYQAELEQDRDVRKQWLRSCDEHQARIREFVTFRDRAK